MNPLTRTLKKKGWSRASLAARWALSVVRIGQILAAPTQLHQDAINGLPGDPEDPYNFDDFEALFAAGNPSEVSAIILAASIKYKWTNKKIRDLADNLNTMIVLAEATNINLVR
jgi:hypothetical protein